MNNMQQLSLETRNYIENKKTEYEEKYQVKMYMWLVRKSFLRGLGRRSSDLDIAYIFDNRGQEKINILFERSDRRVEIQCWSIQDILEIIAENKNRALKEKYFCVYYKNQELRHYILDYYNGFYCGMKSELAGDYDGFWNKCEESIWNLYEPLVPAMQFYTDLKAQAEKLKKGYLLSLNEYLNAVWSGMAGLHLLQGGMPGDVEILKLAERYLDADDMGIIHRLVHYFRKTIQKQSNFGNRPELNRILYELLYSLENQIDVYQVKQADIPANINVIQKYLRERRRK